MSYQKTTRCFLTGCDAKTEWMVPWFLKNYRKHNDTPIYFADFGVSPEFRLQSLSMFDGIYEVSQQRVGGWFYKPQALMKCPIEEVCWLDTDIHVLGDLSGVFDLGEKGKLNMVEDRPWTKRSGEKWHNSGVVLIKDRPRILHDWVTQCMTNPRQGDQEVLHDMLKTPLDVITHIHDLPNIYNWLRIQLIDGEDSEQKLAMHWTGLKGKHKIEKLMYNE